MKLSEILSQLPSVESSVLACLRRHDLPVEEIVLLANVRRRTRRNIGIYQLRNAINSLIKSGYDIQTIQKGRERLYSLVRWAKEEEEIYRPFGEIRTPLLLTGDWHIGSVGWSEPAFFEMLDCIKEERIRHVMHTGDLLQGLGVYRKELKDLLEPSIDAQLDMAEHYLSLITVPMHAVTGNHENVLKGRHEVGFDALKALASRVKNFNYYGTIMNFVLNKKYRYMGLHSSVTRSYATSYSIEKLYRELPEPRPHLLHTGHSHDFVVVPKPPDRLLVKSGSLCRETSYALWRGLTAQIGWIVIKEFSNNKIDYQIYRPRVY